MLRPVLLVGSVLSALGYRENQRTDTTEDDGARISVFNPSEARVLRATRTQHL
jgi:hypothetical protein